MSEVKRQGQTCIIMFACIKYIYCNVIVHALVTNSPAYSKELNNAIFHDNTYNKFLSHDLKLADFIHTGQQYI